MTKYQAVQVEGSDWAKGLYGSDRYWDGWWRDTQKLKKAVDMLAGKNGSTVVFDEADAIEKRDFLDATDSPFFRVWRLLTKQNKALENAPGKPIDKAITEIKRLMALDRTLSRRLRT